MSEPTAAEPRLGTFQARSMIAEALPAESIYPLSDDEFRTLCDGPNNEATGGMTLCIGLFASGIIGLISLVENADWGSFCAHKEPSLFWCLAIMFILTAGSVVGFVICVVRLCRPNSTYSRLKTRIREYFDSRRASYTPLFRMRH